LFKEIVSFKNTYLKLNIPIN